MARRVNILIMMAYYAAVILFVIKPLWWDGLRHEHVKTTYNTDQGYVPVPWAMGENGNRSIQLTALLAIDLSKLETIDLYLATYVQTLRIRDFKITTANRDCTFTAESTTLRDGDYAHFRKSRCEGGLLSPGETLLASVFLEDSTKNIALWTTPSKNKFYSQDLSVPTFEGDKYPVGGFGFAFAPVLSHRAEMINKVWGDGLPHYLLQICVVALLGLPWMLLKANTPAGLGVFAFTTSITMMTLFTLIIPPLQAPDEATHFWNFVNINGRDQLKSEMLNDLQRSHYERVFCHDLEKIDSGDLKESLNADWPAHGFLLDVQSRSFAGYHIWKLYDNIVDTTMPIRVLLGTRALNSLLVSLVLAAFCWLLSRGTNTYIGFSPLVGASLLPTFWHFSAHLSNHTFLIIGYLALVTLTLAVLSTDEYRRELTWPPMAVLVVAALAGRAGIISLCIGLVILAVGAFYSKRNALLYVRAIIVWTLLAALIGFALRHTPYAGSLIAQISGFLNNIGWKMLAFSVGALGVLGLAHHLLIRPQSRLAKSRSLRLTTLTFIWTGVVILFVMPMIHKVNLPNIEFVDRPEQFRYIRLAFFTLISNLGLKGDDFLVIRTLWGGFGCPDNFFPQNVIDVLKALLLIGLGLAFTSHMMADSIFRASKAVTLTLAALLYFGILAASSWQTGATIHGRYILGVALIMLSVASTGLFFGFERTRLLTGWSKNTVTLLLVCCVLILPLQAIKILLYRYYI